MNLVTDRWIPVVTTAGNRDDVNLMQVFTEGEKYADLAVRPHERVALMRLLICIAQAALDGPVDKDDWQEAPKILPAAARNYFKKWNKEEVFELYHPEKPFLQISELIPKDKLDKKGNIKSKTKNELENEEIFTSLSKLDISLATGNTSTLFDHEGSSSEKRILDDKQIALGLITYLNFSSSGRIGVALWNGIETHGKGASFPAPSIDKLMIHTFLRGKSLSQTICLNLLTKPTIERHFGKKDAWGAPVWEKYPINFDDKISILNATNTYLGRLVPLSRFIKIRKQNTDLLLANGLQFLLSDDGKYETSATIKIRKNKRVVLKVSTNAIWRELHAIIICNSQNTSNARGPIALENIINENFDIWCGGVEWSTKGGYLNFIESVYNVSSKMLNDRCRSIYQKEVEHAEHIAMNLGKAIEEYRKNIDGYWSTRTDPKKNKNAAQEQKKLHAKATRSYWTAIEKQRHLLMTFVDVFDDDSKYEAAQKAWHNAIHQAARNAYISACGQETPRQIRAFALGWKTFYG